MNVSVLEKELAKGKLRPAYLLAGSEPLLRDDALAAIESAVLSAGARDFNFDQLEGRKTSIAKLRDATRALPVMAPNRLVVLREPEPTRGAGKELAAGLPELVAELAEQDQTVLVVCASRTDGRSRWVKSFSDPATRVECDPPRGGKAVVSFVRAEAKRQEIDLEAGVAELLADFVGPQLLVLRHELEKAALHAGPGNPVTRAHAEATVVQVSDDPIWDLTDAIGEGRRSDAIDLVARMLRGGAAEPALLGSLASHFRKLVHVRDGIAVAGPPFLQRKLEKQAGRYSPSRLVSCLHAIHETDLALKGAGRIPPNLALERLVLGLSS